MRHNMVRVCAQKGRRSRGRTHADFDWGFPLFFKSTETIGALGVGWYLASPYSAGRPMPTPLAPSAMALMMSEPRRMPPSIHTSILSRALILSSASITSTKTSMPDRA